MGRCVPLHVYCVHVLRLMNSWWIKLVKLTSTTHYRLGGELAADVPVTGEVGNKYVLRLLFPLKINQISEKQLVLFSQLGWCNSFLWLTERC